MESRRGDDRGEVVLRDVAASDLPAFFQHQLDPEANRMAAFTSRDPSDKDAFAAHWRKILADDSITTRTILFNGHVAGSIASFERVGELEVTYWIGRDHWGSGVATRALAEFLRQVKTRPLYARAAKDNLASLRVLEKCGFIVVGEDKGYSNARGEEVAELVLRLAAD